MAADNDRSLLNECLYALGEAMVNTECAMSSEDRPLIKEQFEEDFVFFSDLKKRIQSRVEATKDFKRGIGDGGK